MELWKNTHKKIMHQTPQGGCGILLNVISIDSLFESKRFVLPPFCTELHVLYMVTHRIKLHRQRYPELLIPENYGLLNQSDSRLKKTLNSTVGD